MSFNFGFSNLSRAAIVAAAPAYMANALVLEVDTTKVGSASTTFVLPLITGYTYNFTVYWGDGTNSVITTYNAAALAHVYAAGGIKTVQIVGTCPRVYFNNGGDRRKLLKVLQWGSTSLATNQT